MVFRFGSKTLVKKKTARHSERSEESIFGLPLPFAVFSSPNMSKETETCHSEEQSDEESFFGFGAFGLELLFVIMLAQQ